MKFKNHVAFAHFNSKNINCYCCKIHQKILFLKTASKVETPAMVNGASTNSSQPLFFCNGTLLTTFFTSLLLSLSLSLSLPPGRDHTLSNEKLSLNLPEQRERDKIFAFTWYSPEHPSSRKAIIQACHQKQEEIRSYFPPQRIQIQHCIEQINELSFCVQCARHSVD